MSSILITGATGKQGSSLIQSLIQKNAPFQLLAVTRNMQSPSAQKLIQKFPNVKLVQGDLDNPSDLFRRAKSLSSRPISGVFSVQVSTSNHEHTYAYNVIHTRELHTSQSSVPTQISRILLHTLFTTQTMPPIRSQRSLDLEHQEGRILFAIQAYKNGDFKSIRATALAFDVNRFTLTRRLAGIPQRATLRANHSKLTQLEEDSLVKWIISMDSRGFAPRKHTVREMANILFADRGDTVPQTVGVNWVDNFIARTPAMKLRISRRYDYKYTECEDPKKIQ